MQLRMIAFLIFAIGSFPLTTLACISPPFVETWTNSGSVSWTEGPSACSLDSSVSGPSPSAATVHFRRRSPHEPLQLSFVVDPHLTSLTGTQSATLATGVAERVPVAGPNTATLFQVSLTGNTGGSPRIVLSGACNQAAASDGVCYSIASTSFENFPLRITVEVQIGSGSAGQIHAWLGNDTSGPPTLALDDLDNERWAGVDRVGIGLSDVSPALFAAIGTQAFTFSDISVSDPELFWSGFENDSVGGIAINAGDLSTIPFSLTGSTCGGSVQLPVIASGSTRLAGPTAIHSLAAPSANQRWVQLSSSVPGMVVFACPAGSGPSGPCVQGSVDQGIVAMQPGNYQIVVGSLYPSCGVYQVNVGGTLGQAEP